MATVKIFGDTKSQKNVSNVSRCRVRDVCPFFYPKILCSEETHTELNAFCPLIVLCSILAMVGTASGFGLPREMRRGTTVVQSDSGLIIPGINDKPVSKMVVESDEWPEMPFPDEVTPPIDTLKLRRNEVSPLI